MKKIFILLLFLIFLVSCSNLYDKNDPDIIFANEKCDNLQQFDSNDREIGIRYECFAKMSIDRNNPDVCYLVGAG